MEEENETQQLTYTSGFLRAFKNRLNRVCEKPSKKLVSKLVAQNLNNLIELIFEGEETFLGKKLLIRKN